MENFRLGQLTKELVAAKLRAMDDPCTAAANIVHATISVALQSPLEVVAQAQVIEESCRGGITGLLLAEQNVARGTVLVLRRITEVADANRIDPTMAMESALKGIADLKRFILPERMEELRAAIDSEFMGAGECLRKLLALQTEPAQPSNATAP